jgi:hypothetical protein
MVFLDELRHTVKVLLADGQVSDGRTPIAQKQSHSFRNVPAINESQRQVLELQRGAASRQATPVCDPKLSRSKYSEELALRCI